MDAKQTHMYESFSFPCIKFIWVLSVFCYVIIKMCERMTKSGFEIEERLVCS